VQTAESDKEHILLMDGISQAGGKRKRSVRHGTVQTGVDEMGTQAPGKGTEDGCEAE
jgi:hypothetical protein